MRARRTADLLLFLGLALASAAVAAAFAPARHTVDLPSALTRSAETGSGCLVTPFGSGAIKPGVSLERAQWAMDELLAEAGTDGGARFQPFASRWGPEDERGGPVALTYSFPPDGTIIDTSLGGGFTENPNVIHARLGVLFGSEATWKQHFRDMFDDWAAVTGNSYTEVADDGAAWGTQGPFHGNPGRGDIRIAMGPVTPTDFFAYNNFPENGDMVIDSEWPWGSFGGSFPEWRNMMAHEHGHGQGLLHTCPQDGTKLMEPLINISFLGPQLDDVLSAQFLYGDRFEPSDSGSSAVDLAALGLNDAGSPFLLDGLSLHSATDTDLFRVESLGAATLSVTANPVGVTYTQGPQTSACDTGTAFDARRQADLVLQLFRPNFSKAVTLDASGLGQFETLSGVKLDLPGNWYIGVQAADLNPTVQAYTLTVALTAGASNPADYTGDGCVDSTDLGVLLSNWGSVGADITGDGVANSADLGVLLAAWTGSGC